MQLAAGKLDVRWARDARGQDTFLLELEDTGPTETRLLLHTQLVGSREELSEMRADQADPSSAEVWVFQRLQPLQSSTPGQIGMIAFCKCASRERLLCSVKNEERLWTLPTAVAPTRQQGPFRYGGLSLNGLLQGAVLSQGCVYFRYLYDSDQRYHTEKMERFSCPLCRMRCKNLWVRLSEACTQDRLL